MIGMVKPRLVLASRSETRLRVLRSAGFDPVVAPSDADESTGDLGPAERVGVLAERKARAVAPGFPHSLVLGCDSLVQLGDRVLGKPASPSEAAAWWRAMRGLTVTVWTGHCVVDTATGSTASWIADATVAFASPTDDEIDRYVATGEPLDAAGGFRLDGRAAAYIESVEGDPGTVHGVSVSTVRMLLAELGVEAADLWS